MRPVPLSALALLVSLTASTAVLAQTPAPAGNMSMMAAPSGARTPSPKGAKVYFIDLANGATVPRSVTVRFGLSGMGVAPAGVQKPNTGHHHLLIDTDLPPLDAPIPKDEHHLHFGGGQTETVLQLSPGHHTLQLLLGDGNHMPHQPPVYSERLEVNVE